MRFIVAGILCLFSILARAGTVDTVHVYSRSMKKNIPCIIVKPDVNSESKKKLSTLYLLHGYGGDYLTWLKRDRELTRYADEHQIIIVCPDGGPHSSYIDNPIDPTDQFETFIAIELPAFVDSNYNTSGSRRSRAIAGFSRGGHGALYLAWRHANTFGAAGSMSGALIVRTLTKTQLRKLKKGEAVVPEESGNYSFLTEVETPCSHALSIIIDCGLQDPILDMSRAAHLKLLQLNIPHDYIERPGRHDFAYWRNAIKFQLLFFSNYFNRDN